MRVLGRTRLSRAKDESTSIERQRELIQNWADTHDHEIVGWAEDVDVSGSIDPFDAPELGPWLREPKMHDWDILCAWKMDRLARRTIPLHRLMGWTQDNNKDLVCIADNLDLTSWTGRLVASVIAGVAEGELEAIRERSGASQRKLREIGRWHGGNVPYGYVPVQLPGGGWVFDIEPEHHKVVLRMVEMVLAGTSPTAVARILNEEGIPSPRGGKWSPKVVLGRLRSKNLLGYMMHDGTTVRDSEGNAVMKGPPLIDVETFEKLQEKVAQKTTLNRSESRSPLLGIAVCFDCGKNLHYSQREANGKIYRYYNCPDKCYGQVNGDALIDTTYELFQEELGKYEMREKRITRAVDHSARIHDLSEGIEELTKMFVSAGSERAKERIRSQIAEFDRELERLEKEHSSEERVEWVGTGKTYQEIWDSRDWRGKRNLLRDLDVKVRAKPAYKGDRSRRGAIVVDFHVEEELRERLGTLSIT